MAIKSSASKPSMSTAGMFMPVWLGVPAQIGGRGRPVAAGGVPCIQGRCRFGRSACAIKDDGNVICIGLLDKLQQHLGKTVDGVHRRSVWSGHLSLMPK